MTEEEQKAIEILDTFELRRKTKNYNKLDLNDVYASQIALNLISKQQEIIKNQSYTNKKMRNKIKTVRKERNKLKADIEIKDKVIEKMGEYIKDYDVNVYTGEDNWKDTKQIKQYFYLLCIRKIKESRGRKMKTSELERKLKIKNEYLGLICDFGYDYDSCNTVESLKELIDELVDLAKKGLKNDDKSIMYMSADMKTNYNILHERIENNES